MPDDKNAPHHSNSRVIIYDTNKTHNSLPDTDTSVSIDVAPHTTEIETSASEPNTPQPFVDQTGQSAIEQAQAFLTTIKTPEKTSPREFSTNSVPLTDAEAAEDDTIVIPVALADVTRLRQNEEKLMGDLSILRGEFCKKNPEITVHYSYINEFRKRGLDEMERLYSFGECLRELETVVKSREAAQADGIPAANFAAHIREENARFKKLQEKYTEQLKKVMDCQQVLEKMGTPPNGKHYAYSLSDIDYRIIPNQKISAVHQSRAYGPKYKTLIPKSGIKRGSLDAGFNDMHLMHSDSSDSEAETATRRGRTIKSHKKSGDAAAHLRKGKDRHPTPSSSSDDAEMEAIKSNIELLKAQQEEEAHALANLRQEVAEQEARSRELDKINEEKEMRGEDREDKIREYDVAIKEREERLSEIDGRLAEKQAQLQE